MPRPTGTLGLTMLNPVTPSPSIREMCVSRSHTLGLSSPCLLKGFAETHQEVQVFWALAVLRILCVVPYNKHYTFLHNNPGCIRGRRLNFWFGNTQSAKTIHLINTCSHQSFIPNFSFQNGIWDASVLRLLNWRKLDCSWNFIFHKVISHPHQIF